MSYVYRQPPQYRPQYYRPRDYEPQTLRWLFDRATQQYVRLIQPGGGWNSESLAYNQSPALVSGDVLIVPLSVSGYPITIGSDGIPSIDTLGDSSRLSFTYDAYDTSLSVFGGAAVAYVNNQAPLYNVAEFQYTVGEDGADFSLQGLFTDPEGDSLTFGLAPGSPVLPFWAVLADSTIQVGTPLSEDEVTVIIRATDIAGDYTDGSIVMQSIELDEPPVIVEPGLIATRRETTLRQFLL